MARIVVIGGGMVGLALASRASSKGHDVVVLEAGAGQPGGGNLDTGGEIARAGSYYDVAATRISALSGGSWVWGG